MIEIKFAGADFVAVREEIQKFAVAHLGFKAENVIVNRTQPQAAPPPQPAVNFTHETLETKEPAQKRGPGRPPKNSQPKEESDGQLTMNLDSGAEPTPPPAKMNKTEAAVVTRDDAAQALMKVNDKHGFDRCIAVLKQFDATKISELSPKIYPEFVQTCLAMI